jgi:hypothetical protein
MPKKRLNKKIATPEKFQRICNKEQINKSSTTTTMTTGL